MPHLIRQEYLISYDIEDNKVRTGVFKELLKYGLQPVQKSVFWGHITSAELVSINRYLCDKLNKQDKAFITHSNFNGSGKHFLIGHDKSEFVDWDESGVI